MPPVRCGQTCTDLKPPRGKNIWPDLPASGADDSMPQRRSLAPFGCRRRAAAPKITRPSGTRPQRVRPSRKGVGVEEGTAVGVPAGALPPPEAAAIEGVRLGTGDAGEAVGSPGVDVGIG
jgi:hypothetical protein